ncbi:MAG: DsbA family protein [Anaerolineae bacterium]|nr:DsbA family protein [Anaerolineae bacterium]MCA9890933.1 DsbA family protein [Anaerolineae bacterium]MCB9458828.1 DsbA family protein [Anaerolineaceae bacterium]
MSEQMPDVNKRDETVAVVPRTTLNYVVIAFAFLIVGMVMGVLAIQRTQSPLTEDDVARIVSTAVAGGGGLSRTDLEDVVRDVVGELDLSGDVDPYQYVDDDPYLGPEDAPVVIVEFSAYACPYCGRHFQQTFEPLLENYGEYIRYVFRDYPIINPNVSWAASLAANCANEQGDFWNYHTALFNNQDLISDSEYFFTLAEELELDMGEFRTCFEEQRYNNEINGDYVDGQILSITGTPAFLVNGMSISGAQPYEVFERLIVRELQAAGIEVELGSTAADDSDA